VSYRGGESALALQALLGWKKIQRGPKYISSRNLTDQLAIF
jgi:hypothetical protein|tara:strand:+ start:519 stop:641 length:123 start_codon:yes stop_codon:yes gene_type:complete